MEDHLDVSLKTNLGMLANMKHVKFIILIISDETTNVNNPAKYRENKCALFML